MKLEMMVGVDMSKRDTDIQIKDDDTVDHELEKERKTEIATNGRKKKKERGNRNSS
jgi:hypothetical protein